MFIMIDPMAMCTIYTFCSNMRVSAFYSPFFVNCTQVQIFQTGVKKLKITVEYDFSSFCTNYAPPSFGMSGQDCAFCVLSSVLLSSVMGVLAVCAHQQHTRWWRTRARATAHASVVY